MTASGDYLYVNNKKVMEVIMVRRKDNGKLALPGGFILPEGMLRVMYCVFNPEHISSCFFTRYLNEISESFFRKCR